MRHSEQADLDDPHRNPRKQRASDHDTPTDKVLKLIRLGRSARQIREHLRIPPSRLRRILHSRTFRKAIEMDRQVARLAAVLTGADRANGVRNSIFRWTEDE